MSKFDDGLKLLEERCGGGRDNLISLSTICMNDEGIAMPYSRDVDAYYEDGAFYIMSTGDSLKIEQIENNPNVAFTVCGEWVRGNGIGINLGYVMRPENAEIRLKLREALKMWYEPTNDESDENTIILKVEITKAVVIKDHHATMYYLDLQNNVEDITTRLT